MNNLYRRSSKKSQSFKELDDNYEITSGVKFWVVVDPSGNSELVDVMWETDLDGLGNWFKGGSENASDVDMAVYENEQDALIDAEVRLEIFQGDPDSLEEGI